MKYKREMLKAKKIALEYEQYLNKNSNGKFKFELMGISGTPGEWNVGYNIYESGSIIDGPLGMIINGDGKIISFEEHIANQSKSIPD